MAKYADDTPVEVRETRYAWNGDVSLAYQVLGDGPVDLIYYQGYCSRIDLNWESPGSRGSSGDSPDTHV